MDPRSLDHKACMDPRSLDHKACMDPRSLDHKACMDPRSLDHKACMDPRSLDQKEVTNNDLAQTTLFSSLPFACEDKDTTTHCMILLDMYGQHVFFTWPPHFLFFRSAFSMNARCFPEKL
jgi:hypothetical protein